MSINNIIDNACDTLRSSNCSGAMQYIPELTWLLFLKILDMTEQREAIEEKATGGTYNYSLESPYNWHEWAKGQIREEYKSKSEGSYIGFVNNDLIPYLRELGTKPGATVKQKVISQIMSDIEKTKVDNELSFMNVIDELDKLETDLSENYFVISQVYERLILKMGEKNSDAGQFFTPREVIKGIVKIVDPELSQTVYDPCCGTGGFLIEAYNYIWNKYENSLNQNNIKDLKNNTFYGWEKDNAIYPITLANMVLHGIEKPCICHGNTLANSIIYNELFKGDLNSYDVIMTNPPFGGKEVKTIGNNFEYTSSSTQILFLQHIIKALKPGGKCGMVVDSGIIFRNNEIAYRKTKELLLNTCNLYCIIHMPRGIFVNAGSSGVTTSLIFFNKDDRGTKETWYYDLRDLKVNKSNDFTLESFGDIFDLIKTKPDTERSWTVTKEQMIANDYDLNIDNRPKEKIEYASIEDIVKEYESKLEKYNTLSNELISELKGLIND